jgi:adenosylmethionine-8-amino-7-oxononanoate aminotransferase
MTRDTDPPWLEEGLAHIWLPYTQMKTMTRPVPVVGARGARLTLADGRELIDGISSWWTACHGYAHPHIVEAVQRQAETLAHVMLGGLAHEQAYRLAARLARLLPGDLNRVFFAESGSVSVEIAMKIAVQYWLHHGQRRPRFISFRGGYHGDTFATMSVCDPEEGMHSLFAGVVPGQIMAGLPVDEESAAVFDALLARHAHEAAAVVMEPLVQGAGGMIFHDTETLRRVRAACDRHGVLLILDEIFTGFGRTGTIFACAEAGIVPDVITLSKALTGGTLPLSAAIARDGIYAAFHHDDAGRALMHGPTYMGNALACAAANASLDLFEREPRLDQVARLSAQLRDGLEPARGLPGVRDVRVMGAIGVIELDHEPDREAMKAWFVENGVWVRPFGRIVYTTPPFVITEDELSTLTGKMVKAVKQFGARQ